MLPYVCWAVGGASFSSSYRVLLKGVCAAAGAGKDAELLFATTACLKTCQASTTSVGSPGEPHSATIVPSCLSFPTWTGCRCLR